MSNSNFDSICNPGAAATLFIMIVLLSTNRFDSLSNKFSYIRLLLEKSEIRAHSAAL